MIGVPSRSRVTHLQKFASHVHSDEVVFGSIVEKHLIDSPGGVASHMRRFESPVRQYLTFVGFYQEYSLLAFTDAVEFRSLSEVNRREIQRVIECRKAWDKSPQPCATRFKRVRTRLVE
jgi:hypothetical protein